MGLKRNDTLNWRMAKPAAALVAGQRAQLTLSQIKLRFLYNTLNAMKDLCDEDPEQVKTAIDRFARYLRGNMASIER